MTKMKTHSGLKKRLKVTGTGKFRFKKTGARHLGVRKSNSNKRRKRGIPVLDKSFNKTVRAMLPYS